MYNGSLKSTKVYTYKGYLHNPTDLKTILVPTTDVNVTQRTEVFLQPFVDNFTF